MAYAVLKAFNAIARSRSIHESGVPLLLSAKDISAYLELYESPCEFYILLECIMALDNKFIDKARKRLEGRARKPS